MERKNYPSYSYTDNEGIFHLCPKDASAGLIELIDIDSQLAAIFKMINIIGNAKKENLQKIRSLEQKAESSKIRSDLPFSILDQVIDEYHYSVFYDAANSMSTVGMILPTLESLIYEIFVNIGAKFKSSILKANSCRRTGRYIFDCHYFFNTEENDWFKGLHKGTMQLLNDTGLIDHFPKDFDSIFKALIDYRNCLFHNGFEWPIDERNKFERKIKASQWPNSWFSSSKTDDKPWIFYMSDTLQTRSLELFEEIIISVGKFYLDNENKLI